MKLQHKIAGTILLPLAAATMATSVQAADVDVYGRIQVHVNETTPKGGDMDFSAAGTESRLGFIAKNDMGAKGHIEFDLNGKDSGSKTGEPRLRHAYVNFDNITVGQTWKPSAALELLFPALDPNTNALGSAPSVRVAQVSTKLDLGAGTLNVGVYDDSAANQALPGIAAKFVGDMGGFKVVGAVDMTQADGTSGTTDKTATVITAGVVADLGGMEVKGAFSNYTNATSAVGLSGTSSQKATYMGASVSLPLSGDMKLNAAFENETESKATAMWVNVKTKTASGVDLGAEFRSHDKNYIGTANGTTIGFMANYNF